MLEKIVKLLLVIGALNWGLVGALDMNLVNMVFGAMPMVETVVYIVVGLAGVMGLWCLIKGCKSDCGSCE